MGTKAKKKTRASSTDLLVACPTSQAPIEHPYRSEVAEDEARAGSAKHKALSSYSCEETADLAAIAHEFDVSIEDLMVAMRAASPVIAEIIGWFPAIPERKAEIRLDGPETTGTGDLVLATYDEDSGNVLQLVITDWKTGHGEDEHPKQLASYASGARLRYGMPASGVITVVEAQLRHRERIVRNYSAEDLDDFEAEIRKAHSQIGKIIRPQAGCRWCSRQLICPERHEYVRATSMALEPFKKGAVITREDLGALYPQYQMLTSALRAYDKMLNDELDISPIELPDGRLLKRVDVEQKSPHPAKVARMLVNQYGFDDGDLADVLKASKSGIQRVMAKRRAPKRMGAEYTRRVYRELDEVEGGWIVKIKHEKKIVEAG